jgi:hypothetical protein
MVYQLPKPLPAELIVSSKAYKRVGGQEAVRRGVCSSNDGSWHYYFSKQVVDADPQSIGERRHFSVCSANKRRSVHISMKPHAETESKARKPDEIMIWYRYDDQWTGNKTELAGWGRTHFHGKDADRVAKAVDLLRAFLEAMNTAAVGGTPAPIAPVLSPPLSTFTVVSDEEAERAFQESQSKPPPADNSNVKDSWEDC